MVVVIDFDLFDYGRDFFLRENGCGASSQHSKHFSVMKMFMPLCGASVIFLCNVCDQQQVET